MCDTVAVHLLKNFSQLHDYSTSEVDFIHSAWQLLIHDASERDLGLTMKQEVDARIILDDVRQLIHSTEMLNMLQRRKFLIENMQVLVIRLKEAFKLVSTVIAELMSNNVSFAD